MDLDTLARQAGDVTGPTPDQLHAGRRRLESAAAHATGRVTAHRRSRRTTRAPRRRWACTAIAAAAIAAVTALVLPLGGAPSASADEVLLVTAQSAGDQANTSADAEHWYVGMESDAPDTDPFSTELWFSRDQATILRDGALAAGYLAEEGDEPKEVRTQALDRGEDGEITTSTWSIGGELVTWDELETLPTDPTELEALLREGASGSANADDALWATISDLLMSPAPPPLRQTLWEVAARVPDVELVGPMTDGAGREGTAIKHTVGDDEHAYSVLYILDPATGAVLERQDLDADGDQQYRMTVLTQEPTDTVPVPDPPTCGPGSQPERSC